MSKVVRKMFALVLVTGFCTLPARADEKVKGEPPAKPIIIQLDASKLSPELLKELMKLSKPTEETKPVKGEPGKPDGVKPGVKPEKGEPVKPEGTKPGVKPEKPDGVKPGVKPEKGEPGKPAKAISLTDAIAIAEKTTKGTVVKAEQKTEGSTVRFVVEVTNPKGGTTTLTLDAKGAPADEKGKKDEDKGEKKKGDDDKKKKKDDDDKEEGKGKKKKKKDDDD